MDPTVFTPAFTGNPALGLGMARDPVTNAIVGGQRGYVNLGTIETDGVDMNVRTNFAFGALGTLQNQLQVSYVRNFDVDNTGNQVGQSVGGANGGGNPRWKAALGNAWSYGDLQFVWNLNYTDSVLNTAGNAQVGSWVTNDLQVIYHAPWNGRLTVGVDNVGDVLPPLDGALARGFDVANYDPYGRVPYIRYTQTF